MFYVVYQKTDNAVINWKNDESVGVPLPSAEEYLTAFVKATSKDKNTLGVLTFDDDQKPVQLPTLFDTLVNPTTGQFSPNPNYVPPGVE
jgi:hypothetical protein